MTPEKNVKNVKQPFSTGSREALQRINRAHPDLIFMDMHLAGMNGLELAERIKTISPSFVLRCLRAMICPTIGWRPDNRESITFL
jgi:CheY-like chemotaxis protein